MKRIASIRSLCLVATLVFACAVGDHGAHAQSYYTVGDCPSPYNYDPLCYCQGPVEVTNAFAYTGAHNVGRAYAASGVAYASTTNLERLGQATPYAGYYGNHSYGLQYPTAANY